MKLLLFSLTATVFLCNLYAMAVVILGARRMRSLAAIPPLAAEQQPRVSVIVPACNEEQTIEPALRTMLALDYTPLELIVVNDRSTDRTGEVLARLQEEHPRLRVHEITALPAGWLGKTHALHQGAQMAAGDYLLFTDADIHFEKTTLARAMTLMVDEGLDHLSLIFRNIARGFLLNAMMTDAGGGLFLLFRPWLARDPQRQNFMGVGAFNLVRRSAYLAVGGHAPVRMHPIDDIMLGKVLKQAGCRQDCLNGYDFLQVRWYASPGEMIRGLMKNIFALFAFRVPLALTAVLLAGLLTVFPPWGVLLLSGWPRLLCLLTVAVRLSSFAWGLHLTGSSCGTVPFALLTPYLNIYIILRGMLTTLARDGIDWRGTHYPLAQLRQNPPIL
ncbi:MAG: glycosyltransferase family 2 protein [Desulfobulbaceae bacterium]